MEIVGIVSRWLHISSAVFLLGSALFGKLILSGAAEQLDASARQRLNDGVAVRFRPLALAAILALIASGVYNLLAKQSPPPGYHMWFGIKVLLAGHVIAVSILLGKTGVDPAKRNRWKTGIIATGLVIVALSAYLRSLG